MIWIDLAFLAVFSVAYPVHAYRTFPGTMHAISENLPNARMAAYRRTIFWQCGLCGVGVVVWLLGGRTLTGLGFRAVEGWRFWIALGVAGAIAAGFMVQLRSIQKTEDERRKVRDQLGGMFLILPRGPEEMRRFSLVSVTAGTCEETLYRGWLIGCLAPGIGLPLASVASVVMFGLAHSYGGLGPALRATAMGGVLTVLYVTSGSLWIPIVLHSLIDLNSGMLSTIAFQGRERVEIKTSERR